MKKKLEAELISLAHKILKLKNKSELTVLHQESKQLHEKLGILLFLENHFSDVKPTFTLHEAESKVLEVYETHPTAFVDTPEEIMPIMKSPKLLVEEESIPVIEKLIEEETPQTIVIEEDPEPAFIPYFEPDPIIEDVVEPIAEVEIIPEPIIEQPIPVIETPVAPTPIPEPEIVKPKLHANQVSLDDILENIKPIPTFVKASEIENTPNTSVNNRAKKTVTIGLNDKIAFVKNLFEGNDADFIRVISQLNTLDSYAEANNFIKNMVKPDHNYWKGKEDLEERFMRIIENKFS